VNQNKKHYVAILPHALLQLESKLKRYTKPNLPWFPVPGRIKRIGTGNGIKAIRIQGIVPAERCGIAILVGGSGDIVNDISVLGIKHIGNFNTEDIFHSIYREKFTKAEIRPLPETS
jgi:hypothetical protein